MNSNKNKAPDRITSLEGPELSPKLQQKLKANPFEVPEAYFETLPGRIQQKTTTSREVVPIRPFPYKPILWASAAAILVIFSFTFFLRSELLERKSQLISQNETTLHKIMNQRMDSSGVASTNPRQAGAKLVDTSPTNVPTQHQGTAATQANQLTPSHQKFDQIVKTLEKEGISDEDIMLYLLDENIDPADLSN